MKLTPTLDAGGKHRMVRPSFIAAPLERAIPLAIHVLCRACATGSGRAALDCVAVPAGLAQPPSRRALRLIRQSRISAW